MLPFIFGNTPSCTRRKVHNVTDQVPVCVTMNKTKCQPETVGLVTQERCEVWPVQRCSVEDRQVVKTTPETKCQKVGRKMCPPPGQMIRSDGFRSIKINSRLRSE